MWSVTIPHCWQVIGKVERALLRLRDAPETQQFVLKIPRWLPISAALRERICARRPGQTGPDAMALQGQSSRVRLSRAAPPPTLHKLLAPPQLGHVHLAPTQPFSRRALATSAPSSLPPRIYDDATLAELQLSPKQPAPTFSRRAQVCVRVCVCVCRSVCPRAGRSSFLLRAPLKMGQHCNFV